MISRFSQRTTLLVVVAFCAAACAGRTRRTPDDAIVMVSEGPIRDVDPRFSLSSYNTKVSRLVAPGLTSVDQMSLEPKLELAESIEQLDDVTWDVTLRPGLRFSDGTPLTTADVVYTYESTMSEELGSLYRKAWQERFARFEILDERRVRLHLVAPVATLLSDLDFGIVSKRAAEARGGVFAPGFVTGAGAYRVVAYFGDTMWLQRNPYYHGPPPRTSFIVLRTIRDANARMLVLVGGSADMTQNSVRLDLVSAAEHRKRLKVVSGPSAILTYVMMHNEDPALSDVRVRRAIALAIDRDRIIRAKFHGRAVKATGLLPPMHWAYSDDVRRYDYDPAESMRLLDEAGFPDPDGPGGEPRMRLTYKTSASQFRVAVARIIASQLAEVGIEVEVRSFEFSTFFTDIKQGKYQLASMQTGDITEPDYYYAYFNSSRIPSAENWGLANRWRYRNDRVDELTVQGRRVADRERRRVIYREVQQILADEVPVIPLWHEDNVVVANVDVDGYTLFPNARLRGLETTEKRRR